ncbi:hypothetical protein [Tenacibaculum amylolyticum]|uniref:hypothetical protein n=1 Tax=Tenacibaculum amylolyticum TaxID=104269 RepID=UPI0038944D35
MKRLLFFLLIFSFKIESQLSYIDDRVVNLNDDFLKLNQIITASSFGGNLEEATKLISNVDKVSEEYIIGKSLLEYNLYGKNKSFKFINNLGLESKLHNYYKALVSLLTDNIDDYGYYKKLVKEECLQLKLSIREVLKNKPRETNLTKKINSYLKKVDINSDDNYLFLMLSKIDVEFAYRRKEKYFSLINLYKRYPKKFNSKNLVKYIEDCNEKLCIQVKDTLKIKENDLESIKKLLLDKNQTSIEKQLTEVLKGVINNDSKLIYKSFIFLHAKENYLPRDFRQILGENGSIDLSDHFINFLKEDLDRDQILRLILKNQSFLKGVLTSFNESYLNKITNNELFLFLGLITYLKNEEKDINEYSKLISRVHYRDLQSWNKYLIYLRSNPLHNAVKIPEILTLSKYREVLKKLNEFNNFNYYQKELLLNLLVSNKDYFELNANTSKNILKAFIDLLSLNQSKANPIYFKGAQNNLIQNICNLNDTLSAIIFNSNDQDKDKVCISILLDNINEQESRIIIDKLKEKISKNEHNLNLRNLYLKVLEANKNYKEYLDSYLSDISHYGKLNFSKVVLEKIVNQKLKKRLRRLYKQTKNKEDLLNLITLFNSNDLIEETLNLMKLQMSVAASWSYKNSYVKEINSVFENKEISFKKRLQYIKRISKLNPEVDNLYILYLFYEFVNGAIDEATQKMINIKDNNIIDFTSFPEHINYILHLFDKYNDQMNTIDQEDKIKFTLAVKIIYKLPKK